MHILRVQKVLKWSKGEVDFNLYSCAKLASISGNSWKMILLSQSKKKNFPINRSVCYWKAFAYAMVN